MVSRMMAGVDLYLLRPFRDPSSPFLLQPSDASDEMRYVLPSTRPSPPSRVNTCTPEAFFVAKHGGHRATSSARRVRHVRPSIRRIFSAARLGRRRRTQLAAIACDFVVASNRIVRLWDTEMDAGNVHGCASWNRGAEWMGTCKDPSVLVEIANVEASDGKLCVVAIHRRRFLVTCSVHAPQYQPQRG